VLKNTKNIALKNTRNIVLKNSAKNINVKNVSDEIISVKNIC